jgi:hypothetical protein
MRMKDRILGMRVCLAIPLVLTLCHAARPQTANGGMQQSTGPGTTGKSAAAAPTKPAGIKFTLEIQGDGQFYGQHAGFNTYTASHGEGVTVIYTDLKNATAANDFLQVVVSYACQVISKSEKLETDGKTVGRRYEFLLALRDKDCEKGAFAIAWTDGVKFHEITSPSRKNVLALEKMYRY